MDKVLVKLAKQAAKEEDLVYAPDMAALSWMSRFSQMISIRERERCAQLAESSGNADLAKQIRELE